MISEDGERRALGGVPRERKMLEGHLPRVIYHRVYSHIRRERNELATPVDDTGTYRQLLGRWVNRQLLIAGVRPAGSGRGRGDLI